MSMYEASANIPYRTKDGDGCVRSGSVALYAATFLPTLLLLALAWFQPIYPIGELFRDPLAVAELSDACCRVHFGLISNIGVLGWCATASGLLFAFLLLATHKSPRVVLVFLGASALLTGWLTLDDMFLVHEDVLPALGLSEEVIYVGYGCLGLAYLISSSKIILAARYPMLVIAIGLLGFSVVVDWFFNLDSDLRLFVEDGAKLMGIAAWGSFHIETAYQLVRKHGFQPSVLAPSTPEGAA